MKLNFKKKLFAGLFLTMFVPLTATAQNVLINAENFPDENFRDYLKGRFGNDYITADQIEKYGYYIDVTTKNISSLQGIELFTTLKELRCGSNQLTELDMSKNTELEYLYCGNNQLTKLDVSKNTKLKYLYCPNNQLTELDVSKNTELLDLYCSNNQLKELDVSKNTKLQELSCGVNQLKELDVSKNTDLTYLSCRVNQLTELDASKKTYLTKLDCDDNQLTALDLSNNPKLADIICRNNQLRYLTLDGCDFTTLYCYGNKINGEFAYHAFAGIDYENNAGTTRTIYFKDGEDDENSLPIGTFYSKMFLWRNGNPYTGSDPQPTVSVSVGEDGVATYCPIAPVYFFNAKNIAAYRAIIIEDNTVKLSRVYDYVSRGEGVLLRSLNGGAATEDLSFTTSNYNRTNSFVGVADNGIRKDAIVPEKEEDSNITNFVLSTKNGVVGFYKAKPEGTRVAVGKAYLPVENYDETAAEAGLRIVFDDDATAIDNVEAQQETEDDAIYTLSGVRVTNPTQKGIYIRNGKKVIIK